jgi:hypothetical protein
MAVHREDHWSSEEDLRLVELVKDGKSWVLIAALMKRSVKSIKEHAHHLNRRNRTKTAGMTPFGLQCPKQGACPVPRTYDRDRPTKPFTSPTSSERAGQRTSATDRRC